MWCVMHCTVCDLGGCLEKPPLFSLFRLGWREGRTLSFIVGAVCRRVGDRQGEADIRSIFS